MNYRVKALSLSGLNKRMFDSGDIVTEENFPEGNVPRLIAEGFLEEIPQEPEATSDEPKKEDLKDKEEDIPDGSEEEKSGKHKKKR